ncbi:hypothetical protein F2Q69_00024074 [Brassica cretica]|uniref:Uncharacterized protein n=1 Tax=Brassica cretica TaxID=69181 RepID=A0A8S9QTN6_BRACR|nr:hypothetical protein F2Q69_00024074 [Brassica cretica]
MEFDFRRSDYLAARFTFLAPLVSLHIRFEIGSECFMDLAAQYLSHPIRCSLNFGGLCPAAGLFSMLSEFPFGLIQSVSDGSIGDLLVASFID